MTHCPWNKNVHATYFEYWPSQGAGNTKIHAVLLALKMLSVQQTEICTEPRTPSSKHRERKILRLLGGHKGCEGRRPGRGAVSPVGGDSLLSALCP